MSNLPPKVAQLIEALKKADPACEVVQVTTESMVDSIDDRGKKTGYRVITITIHTPRHDWP